jgi:hypothetical protein
MNPTDRAGHQNSCGFEINLYRQALLYVRDAVLSEQQIEFAHCHGRVRACFEARKSGRPARFASRGRKPAPSFLNADFVIAIYADSSSVTLMTSFTSISHYPNS